MTQGVSLPFHFLEFLPKSPTLIELSITEFRYEELYFVFNPPELWILAD